MTRKRAIEPVPGPKPAPGSLPFGQWVRQVRQWKQSRDADPDRYNVTACARRANKEQSWWSRLEASRSQTKSGMPSLHRLSTILSVSKGLEEPIENIMQSAGYLPSMLTYLNTQGQIEVDVDRIMREASEARLADAHDLLLEIEQIVNRVKQAMTDQPRSGDPPA